MSATVRGMDLKGKSSSAMARLPISLVFSALVSSEVLSSSSTGTSSSSLESIGLTWQKMSLEYFQEGGSISTSQGYFYTP